MNRISSLLAPLVAMSISSSALAQPPQAVSDAIQRLRDAPGYSWTATTSFVGAPISVAPIDGTAHRNGLVVLTSEAGKRSVVAKGDARVLKTSAGWKSAADLGDVNDPANHDLLTAQPPLQELVRLLETSSSLQSAGENSFTGTLGTAEALAQLETSLAGRPPPRGITPEIEMASGTFQLWLENGLPRKYTLTIDARIVLPFGTKGLTRLRTTQIHDVGSTISNVPAEARQLLKE